MCVTLGLLATLSKTGVFFSQWNNSNHAQTVTLLSAVIANTTRL